MTFRLIFNQLFDSFFKNRGKYDTPPNLPDLAHRCKTRSIFSILTSNRSGHVVWNVSYKQPPLLKGWNHRNCEPLAISIHGYLPIPDRFLAHRKNCRPAHPARTGLPTERVKMVGQDGNRQGNSSATVAMSYYCYLPNPDRLFSPGELFPSKISSGIGCFRVGRATQAQFSIRSITKDRRGF